MIPTCFFSRSFHREPRTIRVFKQNKPSGSSELFKSRLADELVRAELIELPAEVPATLQHYLDGTVEQFWFREKLGPIFLMNVESVEQAKASLAELPLVANDLVTYEVRSALSAHFAF